MSYAIRNVTELRADFWREHPHLECRRYASGRPRPQNEQPTDTRCAFVDYIDSLRRNESISESLAQSATL